MTIAVYERNPWYWQYDGEPTLLVGGSDDENVFQWPEPEMTAHLDLLRSVGGNYDRCTLSSRPDRGMEIYPFAKADDGRYDLSRWNDEFWVRLERYLRACSERDIVVQLEVWATYDLTSRWSIDVPYNPRFNSNYQGPPETILGGQYEQFRDVFDFYRTVPALGDDAVVSAYQRAFVDRVLEHTLPHDNILYCVDNEYAFVQPWQWFRYWAEYIREKARAQGRDVPVTEMNLQDWELARALASGEELAPALRERLGPGSSHVFNRNHREVFDHPEVYGYVDFSDNGDSSGQRHADQLAEVRAYLQGHPRPLNLCKIYGADFGVKWPTAEGVNAFWRSVFGGAGAVRFHRPPTGIGLSPKAQASIRAVRKLEEVVRPWASEPYPQGIRGRGEDGAYAMAGADETYGLFFPGSSCPTWVKLVPVTGDEPLTLTWIDISIGEWGDSHTFIGNAKEGNVIATPKHGGDFGWVAAVRRAQGQEREGVLPDHN